MIAFATYLHPHTCYTSRPIDEIEFVGHSVPHFSRVREALASALIDYPSLPVRKADYAEYARVHDRQYLQDLAHMAQNVQPEIPPRLSIECTGMYYCLPGYAYGLGGLLEAIEQMKLDGEFYRAPQILPAFQAALDSLPWMPDLVLIFSGYDAHRDDGGAGITDWTDDDFRQLTRRVLDLSKRAGCPVLSVHGGGYNLPVTIAAAVSHVEVLAGY
jgi:acetoin utilization deacetylase AcuC-like enzyme